MTPKKSPIQLIAAHALPDLDCFSETGSGFSACGSCPSKAFLDHWVTGIYSCARRHCETVKFIGLVSSAKSLRGAASSSILPPQSGAALRSRPESSTNTSVPVSESFSSCMPNPRRGPCAWPSFRAPIETAVPGQHHPGKPRNHSSLGS